jgi:hypothetical protein
MRSCAKILLLGTLFFSAISATSFAATKGRIMTDGKIMLYKDGLSVTSYTGQGPLDENALMSCEGTCMVKMQGIALSAVDQTRFAVKEQLDSVHLFVEKGKVFFVITDLGHRFSFYSPDGYYIRTSGFVAPASTGGSVKGFVNVSETAMEIGMDDGTMVVQTEEGTQTIQPGQSIRLAIAEVPEEGNPAGGGNPPGNDPGGGAVWGGFSNAQVAGIAIGVGTAAGVGYLATQDSNNTGPGPGPGAGPGPGTPASPNF